MRYDVNTFHSTFMLKMSLKTLNIILMRFDGIQQPFEKNTIESKAQYQ